VSPRIFVELTGSPHPFFGAHTDSESDANPGLTIIYHRCFVRRLHPPLDPNTPSKPTSALNSAPAPRVLLPTPEDMDTRDVDAGKDSDNDIGSPVYVGWSLDIPEGHIAPSFLWEGLAEWDLVRCEAELYFC
jgi:hypothetical protein